MGFVLTPKTGTETNTESETGTMMQQRGFAGSMIRSYLSNILSPVQKTSAHTRLNFCLYRENGKTKNNPNYSVRRVLYLVSVVGIICS